LKKSLKLTKTIFNHLRPIKNKLYFEVIIGSSPKFAKVRQNSPNEIYKQ